MKEFKFCMRSVDWLKKSFQITDKNIKDDLKKGIKFIYVFDYYSHVSGDEYGFFGAKKPLTKKEFLDLFAGRGELLGDVCVIALPVKKLYYVVGTDKFLSGWGKAQGRKSKVVYECDTYEEAEKIEANLKARSEMKYVSIRRTKPYYNPRLYVTSYYKNGRLV